VKTITAVVAIALSMSCSLATAEKPNIVYILADDLGYADVGFNGGKQILTPELDKLAREGAILKDFYVQPCCSATRAALMTGRHPMRTGLYGVVNPGAPWGLNLEERTLADALRDAGYETAICGKWHLGEFQEAYRPTRRGFDHQYGLWFGNIDYFTHQRNGRLDWHRNDQLCYDEGYSTHLIAKEACRIIREKSEKKPLFLYVPFMGGSICDTWSSFIKAAATRTLPKSGSNEWPIPLHSAARARGIIGTSWTATPSRRKRRASDTTDTCRLWRGISGWHRIGRRSRPISLTTYWTRCLPTASTPALSGRS